jgi:hypothetical protein
MICRNIFYNCEHTVAQRQRFGRDAEQYHRPSNDQRLARTGSALQFRRASSSLAAMAGPATGASAIYEGNIAFDLDPVIQANPFPLYNPASSFLVVSRSLTQGTNWPGTGNLSGDPLFVNAAGPMTAQNIKSNLMLMLGSPCIGTGPNGLDMGALVPSGASISGVPGSPTTSTSATLRVAGPGVVAYRWKLNNGPWSPEIPLTNSFVITTNYFNATNGVVTLTNLSSGTNTFYAIGKNSAGAWQDTNAAAARTWIIETAAPLRIDEISITGDTVEIKFTGLAGNGYTIYRRDSLQRFVAGVRASRSHSRDPDADVHGHAAAGHADALYQISVP